jgi:type IV secretory pathway protease TraF
MVPTYNSGEHALTINWWYSIKVHDVIVAIIKGRPVIKRVTQLKKDKGFLEGDNKGESTDSRTWGWIAKSDIIGIILCKF